MFPPELAELVRNAPKATLRRPAEPYEVIALEDGLTAEAALVMLWKDFPARSRPQA